jgi:SAM-dependent methyltransferase
MRPAAVSGAKTPIPLLSWASVGDAASLPLPDRRFDVVASALALNFVPDPHGAVAEFVRVAAPDGLAAAYVWDYAEGMAMMRCFWDAAIALSPAAAERDEGRRFPLCRPEPLARLWTRAGLEEVRVRAIEISIVFADFDDHWRPFLGGQGPAPGYVTSLTEEHRGALRELLRERLPSGPDGSIPLTTKAWAVRGQRPFRPRCEPGLVRVRCGGPFTKGLSRVPF